MTLKSNLMQPPQNINGICEAKWHKVNNTPNILLNTAQLGGTFFHHAHAYAIHIVNSCPAKNVTDRDGNPTTPLQYSYVRKPSLANFRIFGLPVYFKRYEPTSCNKLITYNNNFRAHPVVSSMDSQKTQPACYITLLNIPSTL